MKLFYHKQITESLMIKENLYVYRSMRLHKMVKANLGIFKY